MKNLPYGLVLLYMALAVLCVGRQSGDYEVNTYLTFYKTKRSKHLLDILQNRKVFSSLVGIKNKSKSDKIQTSNAILTFLEGRQ